MAGTYAAEGRLKDTPVTKNLVTNPAFNWWQRGTGFTINQYDPGTQTADEWIATHSADFDSNPFYVSQGSSYVLGEYYLDALCDPGSVDPNHILQIIDNYDDFNNSFVTFSAKAFQYAMGPYQSRPFIAYYFSATNDWRFKYSSSQYDDAAYKYLSVRFDFKSEILASSMSGSPMFYTPAGSYIQLPRPAAVVVGVEVSGNLRIDDTMLVVGDYPEGIEYSPLNDADDALRARYYYNASPSDAASTKYISIPSVVRGESVTINHGTNTPIRDMIVKIYEKTPQGVEIEVTPEIGGVPGVLKSSPTATQSKYFDQYTLMTIPLNGIYNVWGAVPFARDHTSSDPAHRYLSSARYNNPASNDYSIKTQAMSTRGCFSDPSQYSINGWTYDGSGYSYGYKGFINSGLWYLPQLSKGPGRSRGGNTPTNPSPPPDRIYWTPAAGLEVDCGFDFLDGVAPPLTIEFVMSRPYLDHNGDVNLDYNYYESVLTMTDGPYDSSNGFNLIEIAINAGTQKMTLVSHYTSMLYTEVVTYTNTFTCPTLFDNSIHHVSLVRESSSTASSGSQRPWTLFIDGNRIATVQTTNNTIGTNNSKLFKYDTNFPFSSAGIIVGNTNLNSGNRPFFGSIGGIRISDCVRYDPNYSSFSMAYNTQHLATQTYSRYFQKYLPTHTLEYEQLDTNNFKLWNFTGRDLTNLSIKISTKS